MKKNTTQQPQIAKVVQNIDIGADISKNDAEFFDEKIQEKGKKTKKKAAAKRKPAAEKSILELATDSEPKQVHSDDDQFEEKSQKTIKRKRGKRLTMPAKSKKSKSSKVEKPSEVDEDLPTSGVVIKDKQNDRLPPSSITSLDDLIESKKKGDDDFVDMPDITAVSKDTSLNETIDLDNYGEVSLENVK